VLNVKEKKWLQADRFSSEQCYLVLAATLWVLNTVCFLNIAVRRLIDSVDVVEEES